MQRQDVGLLEERGLAGGHAVTSFGGAFGRCLLAPDQHLHAEPSAGLGNQGADVAQAKNAQRAAAQPVRQRHGPFAPAHAFGFQHDVAAGGHHQRDRQFGGGNRRVALAGRNHHPVLGRGGVVDGGRVAADQRDHFKVGQPRDERAGEFDPFADRDDDLGRVQACHQYFEIGRGLAVDRNVVALQQIVAVQVGGDVLVFVWDDNVHVSTAPNP